MTRLGWLAALPLLLGAQEGAKAPAAMAVWDTVKPSAQAYDAAALAGHAGWSVVARDQALPGFKGDAVVSNGRVTLVIRRQGDGVELHAAAGELRARLVLQGAKASPTARPDRLALPENSRAGSLLDVSFKTGAGEAVAAKLRLKRGEVGVEIEPGAGAVQLRLEAPGRFLVLPDFFADDIVVDATKIPLPAAEVPSDNFVLHLAAGGGSIVMGAFENRDDDVRVTLAGEGEKREITGSEIRFGKDKKKAWVSLIEAPNVWHQRDVKPEETGKAFPLSWTMPFPAQWRTDFSRGDGLFQSWSMLLQQKEGGEYAKPSVTGRLDTVGANRKFWTGSIFYSISYPCWSDPQGKGHFQPLQNRWVSYKGPALIYPMNRVASTPADVFTVVDVARAALGQGPCEYILDVEGQKSERKGRATCSVRDELMAMYKAGEQKQRRAEAEQFLKQGIDFVRHIRGRVESYLELQRSLKEYLAAQRTKQPALAEPIGQLEKVLREIDSHLEDRKDKIKDPESGVRLVEEFRKTLLDYTGADAVDKVKAWGEAFTEVGGNQDDLVARCRWTIKTLRQRAALLTTATPALAPVADEIRKRTQAILKNPAMHEETR